MNGKFELDVTHKIDPKLKEALGYLVVNPTALELTRLAAEYKMKPDEILELFRKIRKGLVE